MSLEEPYAISVGEPPGRLVHQWDVIYSEFDEIHQELRSVGDFIGSVLTSTDKADLSLFTESEIKVMEYVLEKFNNISSRDLSKLSHKESAWTNHHDLHEIIPFSEAFHLKAV